MTASGCVKKDPTCVQDCGAARETCEAPVRATLAGALATCTVQLGVGVTTCQAANPSGSAALAQCVEAAQANAFACNDAAVATAGQGLAACIPPYVACVRACPNS